MVPCEPVELWRELWRVVEKARSRGWAVTLDMESYGVGVPVYGVRALTLF